MCPPVRQQPSYLFQNVQQVLLNVILKKQSHGWKHLVNTSNYHRLGIRHGDYIHGAWKADFVTLKSVMKFEISIIAGVKISHPSLYLGNLTPFIGTPQ